MHNSLKKRGREKKRIAETSSADARGMGVQTQRRRGTGRPGRDSGEEEPDAVRE